MNDFERQLRRAEFRAPPREWREKILDRCLEPTNDDPAWSWRDWLWPSPLAWGALAALWMAFFTMGHLLLPNDRPHFAEPQDISPARLSSLPLLASSAGRDLDPLLAESR